MMGSDSVSPIISPIKLSVQYSVEKQDKLKANYKEWSEEIIIALSLNGLYEYITGTIPEPATSEHCAHSNWNENSCLVYAFLASSVAHTEHSFLDISQNVSINWNILKERHQNEGPVC